MDFRPLHDGPHDSVGDLTPIDYVLIVAGVLALVALGFALWYVLKRRQQE